MVSTAIASRGRKDFHEHEDTWSIGSVASVGYLLGSVATSRANGFSNCRSSQSLMAAGNLPHSMPRAYNPVDYDHLNVSPEIKDLFQYIGRYKPQEVELETTLRCFIPDFIPAVGEMDAFVKVPPPDGQPDDLGLKARTGFKFIPTPSQLERRKPVFYFAESGETFWWWWTPSPQPQPHPSR